MSDTSLALRILNYAGHVRPKKMELDVAKADQIESADQKANAQAKNAARNVVRVVGVSPLRAPVEWKPVTRGQRNRPF